MGSDFGERLRFGVLGPLAAWRGDRALRLGGARQRTLLALLIVRANELVRTDTLVDELFGERRSETGLNALRVAVSRLRQALGTGEEEGVLLTRPSGYALQLDPEQLDATRFEGLVHEARELIAAGELDWARARLRTALDLWRGAPLVDLGGVESLQPEIRRLEELRLLAVMERIDADLGLGAGAGLIGELEALISVHPLQERMRGQLMRALYRAGRQPEALAVYRRTSELLRDELGLEPGLALRALERAILAQDPALDAQPPPRAARVPGNLPTPATALIGRDRELAELARLLERNTRRLLTLTGAGGSGKTRLALALAQARTPSQGAWFVALADVTDGASIPAAICQALELAEHPTLTPQQRLQAWAAERDALLVLDNLEQVADGAVVIAELLAGAAGIMIIATSREPLHLSGEQCYEVPVLALPDAVALFIDRVRAVAPRVSADASVAAAICERLDCLPLAIELAAARAKALSPHELLGRLKQRLPLLTGGPRDAPRRQRTLRATLDWSYGLLRELERRLFERFAIFAGGAPLNGVETVCEAELDVTQALVERSLLRTDGTRYWMLQTVREYAFERLQERGELDSMRRAHARWCTELIRMVRAEGAHARTPALRALVVRERENLRAALHRAVEAGDLQPAAQMVWPLTHNLWIREGQIGEAQRWVSVVLEGLADYPPAVAADVLMAARAVALQTGPAEDVVAYSRQALAIFRRLGDLEGMGWAMIRQDHAATERGDLVTARSLLQDTVAFAREHGLHCLPMALANLADLDVQEGRLSQARALLEEALHRSDAAAAEFPIVLMNLAEIACLEARYAEAAPLAQAALRSATAQHDHLYGSWAALTLAWALAHLGETARAATLLGASLEFLQTSDLATHRTDITAEAGTLDALRQRLDEATVQALIQHGRRTPLDEAFRDAARWPTATTPAQPPAFATGDHNT